LVFLLVLYLLPKQMLNKKTIKKFLTFSLFIFMSFNLNAADSYFDKSEKTVVCKEPLPIFTLGENSNPSNKQVRTLCSCIWNEFPTTGWERETSEKIRNGIDPGWRGKGLVGRFSKALEKCGGYNL